MISILIIEDHTIVRAGLVNLLGQQPDMTVTGETGQGRHGLTLARELAPDVVLLDMDLPDIEGIEVTEQLTRTLPDTAVIILTMYESEDLAARALQAGALGYLVKGSDPAELADAIRAVVQGRPFVTPAIRDRLLLLQRRSAQGNSDPVSLLSDRERQVLLALAGGLSMPAAADKLCLSVSTVKTYKRRIQEKLGLETIPDFVKFCIRNGLMDTY